MDSNPIQKAAAIVGSQSALARILQVTPQAVQHWCAKGFVPAERVVEIERATSGKVTRQELRPDLYAEAS